ELNRIEAALKSLVAHSVGSMPSNVMDASEAIKEAAGGQIITVGYLAQKFNISVDEALKVLTTAVGQNQVAVRFRVRTTGVLEKFENRWRSSLAEFPKSVVDETGTVFDLSDRSNVEVAFERLG